MRKRTFSPLTILLVMLFVIGCQFPTGSATSQSVDKISSPTSLPTLTVVASTPTLPPEILEVSYDSLARETEQYVGKMVHYYGEIVQVIEGNDLEAVLRVNVTKNTYGWQDTVWINYEGPRLLEDDLIEVWGVVVGRRTYESIFGASITVPEIDAVTLERVAITVSSGLGTLAPQDTDEPTKGTASNPATIGEVLTFGNLSLCVLGWGEIDETGRSIGPDDGYRWIYVDVVMLNQGESSTDVSISTSVRDDTGHSFDASPSLMHSGSWWMRH